MSLWMLVACVDTRAPLSLSAQSLAADCGDLDALDIPLERLWLQRPASLARRVSAPGVAFAHPGHDPSGPVTGEIIGPWALSPCDGDAPLGVGRGYASPVATGQLTLLGDARLVRGASAASPLPIDIAAPLDHPVTGLPLAAKLVDGATARLRFDPALTLSVLPTVDTDGDGALTEADDGALAAFTYGLVNPNSWTLTVESP